MGYTHYWDINLEQVTPEQFNKVVEEVKKIHSNLPKRTTSAGGYYSRHHVKIMGGSGVGEPIFTEKEIRFNGCRKNRTNHDTMSIALGESCDSDFCKTARKPYDLLVCCTLIALANNLPAEVFGFESNGDFDDWEPAIDLYTQIIGMPQQHVIDTIKQFK
jgi:hypothetical protein